MGSRQYYTHTLEMNSMSDRSMSLMTMIFMLARKCSDVSVTASRKIDFWINRTLQPVFLIVRQRFSRYLLSSRKARSICV